MVRRRYRFVGSNGDTIVTTVLVATNNRVAADSNNRITASGDNRITAGI